MSLERKTYNSDGTSIAPHETPPDDESAIYVITWSNYIAAKEGFCCVILKLDEPLHQGIFFTAINVHGVNSQPNNRKRK